MKERSFWADTVIAQPAAPTPLPSRVDVLVVGGGITGLCTARALARRGISVAVLETHSIGWGASSRNGGMVLTGHKVGAATLRARYGTEQARRLYRASIESVDLVAEIVRSEGIDCDFHRYGHLALASKAGHYDYYCREAELLAREFDHEIRLVPRADLHAEIGSGAYFGGVVDEVSGGINPARYVAGLAVAARRAGATVHERCTVGRIERHGARWRVTSSGGVIDAGELVMATSGYTGTVAAALERKLVPIGSYVIATEPLPEALARELSPHGRMMYDSWHFLHYFRLTPDRRLLFGGRAQFVPDTPDTIRDSAAELRRGMLEIHPQLRAVNIDYAWGGTLDFSYDTMPHMGEIDGYYYALGYAGHGVALASLLGTQLGETLGTAGLQQNVFAQLPFVPLPFGFHRAKRQFLRLAGMWFRLLDRLT